MIAHLLTQLLFAATMELLRRPGTPFAQRVLAQRALVWMIRGGPRLNGHAS